jgi:hypothetical protein
MVAVWRARAPYLSAPRHELLARARPGSVAWDRIRLCNVRSQEARHGTKAQRTQHTTVAVHLDLSARTCPRDRRSRESKPPRAPTGHGTQTSAASSFTGQSESTLPTRDTGGSRRCSATLTAGCGIGGRKRIEAPIGDVRAQRGREVMSAAPPVIGLPPATRWSRRNDIVGAWDRCRACTSGRARPDGASRYGTAVQHQDRSTDPCAADDLLPARTYARDEEGKTIPFCERWQRDRACRSHGPTSHPNSYMLVGAGMDVCTTRASLLCAEQASGGWARVRSFSLAGDPAGRC